jgi:hypothetical protein
MHKDKTVPKYIYKSTLLNKWSGIVVTQKTDTIIPLCGPKIVVNT